MSVQKTPTGYIVRWRDEGRNRARRFDKKADADAWDREVKRRKQLGPLALEQLTSAGPTLGEWIATRWAPEHGALLQKRTRSRYATSWTHHIAPWLEQVPLREITVGRLREWQAHRLRAGVSSAEVRQCRAFLSSVLRHAAESEAIPANPMGLVRAPKVEQRDEVVPLAPSTVERMISVAMLPMPHEIPAGPGRRAYLQPDQRPASIMARDGALIALLAYAGLRPSEALGLRWDDVGERVLVVQRATDVDGTLKTTKGRKSRTVKLLEPLADDLRAWRASAGASPSSLVFPRSDGTPWTAEDLGNWRARTWRRAALAAGYVKAPRPYDLRHSFASLLLAEHRTVHYVAQQLGNSPQMVFDRYGHVMAEFADAERVDAEIEIQRARNQARTHHVLKAVTAA